MKVEEALISREFNWDGIQNGLEIRASSFERVIRTLGKDTIRENPRKNLKCGLRSDKEDNDDS